MFMMAPPALEDRYLKFSAHMTQKCATIQLRNFEGDEKLEQNRFYVFLT